MPQRLHNKKTPLTGRRKCGILYMSAAECRWPTIALLEMTGFYNEENQSECNCLTIVLLEMTGFYNKKGTHPGAFLTIALPETAGLCSV